MLIILAKYSVINTTMKTWILWIYTLLLVTTAKHVEAKEQRLSNYYAYHAERDFTKKAFLLEDLLNEGLDEQDLDLFQSEVEKLLEHATKTQDVYLLNFSRFLYGYVYIKKEQYEVAEKITSSALAYFKKENDSRLLGFLYRDLGVIQLGQGKKNASLTSFRYSQDFFKESNNMIEYTHSRALEAKNLIYFKKFNEAIAIVKSCVPVMQKAKKYKSLFMYYNIFADVYSATGNKVKEAEANRQSARVAVKSGDPHTIALSKNNLAIANFYAGQTDSAIVYFESALETRKRMGKNRLVCETYYNLGSVYSALEDYPSAIAYFNLSMELANAHDLLIDLGDAYLALAEIYEALGQFKEATAMNKAYITVQEKVQQRNWLSSNESTVKLMEFEAEKAAGNRYLEKKRAKTRIEKEQNKVAMLLVGNLVLLVGIVVFYFWKQKSVHLRG